MRWTPGCGPNLHPASRRAWPDSGSAPGPRLAAGPQGDPTSGEAEASGPGQPMSGRELLPATSFSLTAETHGEGLYRSGAGGAVTRFGGRKAGAAGAGGDVAVDARWASGLLGAGWGARALDDRAGDHAQPERRRLQRRGGRHGKRDAHRGMALDALCAGERLWVWGVAGYGDGRLTLEPRAEVGARAGAIRTDLDLWMAAAGCAAWRSTVAATVSLWR